MISNYFLIIVASYFISEIASGSSICSQIGQIYRIETLDDLQALVHSYLKKHLMSLPCLLSTATNMWVETHKAI